MALKIDLEFRKKFGIRLPRTRAPLPTAKAEQYYYADHEFEGIYKLSDDCYVVFSFGWGYFVKPLFFYVKKGKGEMPSYSEYKWEVEGGNEFKDFLSELSRLLDEGAEFNPETVRKALGKT